MKLVYAKIDSSDYIKYHENIKRIKCNYVIYTIFLLLSLGLNIAEEVEINNQDK